MTSVHDDGASLNDDGASVDDDDESSDDELPALPQKFSDLAAAMPLPVRCILVDGVPPEHIPLPALLESLGLKPRYPEHSYKGLRSLRLLRLAQGLLPEPPLVEASEADMLRREAVLCRPSCRSLRELVDDDARRSAAADSVDGAPDHQVDLQVDSLRELVGDDQLSKLCGLVGALGGRGDDTSRWTPSEMFVRRYSPMTRPWIPFHCDRAAYTVNVALSDDSLHSGGLLVAICGGGVQAIPRQEGDATAHSSNLCHAVTRMEAGTRYSLILFFNNAETPS